MSLPLCKCGHDAFSHSDRPSHCCSAAACECVRFKAQAQPTVWPDLVERRRYALLAASAEIGRDAKRLVDCAEALLAEIERRETAKEAK